MITGSGRLSFGAAEFARLEQSKKEECGSNECERDPDERGSDRTERKQIQEESCAERGHDGLCGVTAGEVVGMLHPVIGSGQLSSV